MTYVHQGRQFILVAVAANQEAGTTAQLVAYALPAPGGRGNGGRGARGGGGRGAGQAGEEPGAAQTPAGAPANGGRGQRGQQ